MRAGWDTELLQFVDGLPGVLLPVGLQWLAERRGDELSKQQTEWRAQMHADVERAAAEICVRVIGDKNEPGSWAASVATLRTLLDQARPPVGVRSDLAARTARLTDLQGRMKAALTDPTAT